MGATLRQFLEFVTPATDSKLLIPEARVQLLQLAEELPDVARTLLECRLLPGSNQVDLSQSLLRSDSKRLQQYVLVSGLSSPAWRRSLEFLSSWGAPDSILERAISGIWLEVDLDLAGTDITAEPCLFLDLATQVVGTAQTREVLRQALESLSYHDPTEELLQGLEVCVAQLPGDVALSYVGLMLARRPTCLRAQFSGFSKDSLLVFLESLNFHCVDDTLATAVDLADEYFQSLVLCLDLQPNVSTRVGLELFPSQYREGLDDRAFLRRLTESGFCTEEKRDEVLNWPRVIKPGDLGRPWPERLLIESLLKSPDQFGLIERRINHFKVVTSPGQPLEVKVYLSADHVWASSLVEVSAVSDK